MPDLSRLTQLALQCKEDSDKYFPVKVLGQCPPELMHHVVGMGGEAGEVLNIIKKIDRGSLSLKEAAVFNHLAEEVTDIFIYLLNIAAFLHIDLEKTYERKRSINHARFIEDNDSGSKRGVRPPNPRTSSSRG